ncbi:Germacrene C synthase [Datura stramonium]|uniref:Germacrene C synthase n=1 Tax=Datura stramonium TaxID=4076 RepID=A0ABS8WWC4_DATST|nr:Germacrene C synthase [Datura stramonium]
MLCERERKMSIAMVTFPMFQSTCGIYRYRYSSCELRVQSSLGGRRKERRINKATVASSSSSSRPLADFQPTVWGDHFLSYTFQQTKISSQEKLEHEDLKERIRKMLVETPDCCTQKLVLIDAIQRMGVAYHFDNEIETFLQNIFDASSQQNEINDDNLYVVALRFRLVRQQGHYMSSDVFEQFTDHDGKFKKTLINDVQGLLSLYEAAHLSVHGEEILEEALAFTITHLESMVPILTKSLKVQVTEALSHPVHRTIPRVVTGKYINIYENMESHNHLLLKFAKLDFNMLQKLHHRELSELTRWWKDVDLANKLPYARDKLVESYFWTLGVYFEPQYSRARKLLVKVFNMISTNDDTYDAYATLNELVLYTDAIQKWDISAMDSLPPYMRPLYQVNLDIFSEMEEELAKEGNSERIYYGTFEMKKLLRSYFEDAKWYDAGYIPKCEEYIKNALVSSAIMTLSTNSLVGMERFIAKDIFEWVMNEPLIVRASSAICRLMDDIIDHEVQQERGHAASIIECYMKEYGASKEEAYTKYRKEVKNAWKDINKALMRPTEVPMFVLERPLNLARLLDTLFKDEDGYTNSHTKCKDLITMLLTESFDI